MKHCLLLDLKDKPQQIAEYEQWHMPERIWPEITKGIKEVGIQEMEIFRWQNRLVMLVETADDFNWETQMTKLSTLPRQHEWELLMDAYQQRLTSQSSEKWQTAKNIFKLTKCP